MTTVGSSALAGHLPTKTGPEGGSIVKVEGEKTSEALLREAVAKAAEARSEGGDAEDQDDCDERRYKCTVDGCDRRYKNLQGVKLVAILQ